MPPASSWYTRPNDDGTWYWRAYVGSTSIEGVAGTEQIARQQAAESFAHIKSTTPSPKSLEQEGP